ncbi:hypothetical protein L598_002700000500 [Mesorhizobium sp. J18]|uniref:hypothetical protein n=1 Tax=Mesorhizobium sp. J18 TaxID=935263 RepID=UPI00119BB1F8|nr:hypothetical protein [Mesorhizobium sp. J18]TWG96320.1 hypothetical protein L598_002700000500 [Mesorhizobium sp. J18]
MNFMTAIEWLTHALDRFRERREQAARFYALVATRFDRIPALEQKEIDEAHESGCLQDRLEREKTAIQSLVKQVEKEVGGVRRDQYVVAFDILMRRRLDGLDLHGWRWFDLNFSKKPLLQRIVQGKNRHGQSYERRRRPAQYMENATGRVMDEDEFVAKGGLVRPLKFTRIK